ncbi:RNA polymerase sigma factor [Pseudoduganella armeniaca]|uniref:RNA polymerase subunit sigma-24 n=1 Tax=Pseudoduganella armeniaca TaxID=2072590 RepID=A0A2R4CDH8_9BURK|nr:RNA polymerase sigma factor [Pseudoduganella armeniaca]AVR97693.1 RNA polymerase subunit sigma-24 [Pseudoduganella armeniaca]
MSDAVRRAVEAVWRIESARIVAVLTRMLRDVGLAEEMAQEALVSALETWPANGTPDNPAAWLMTAAKHRALDWLRHRKLEQEREPALTYEIEGLLQDAAPDLDRAVEDKIGDDLLRLVFIACHPVLPTEGRVALTLRLLGGLTTDEIARAFLVPEPTVAQRIVRAKRTLAEARVPFEVPVGHELVQRLASVLQVVYLIYNEGYAASAGADWMRPALCEEALRLGRILAGLAPREPEVHGLAALMEIQSSRARARTDAQGAPVLLLEQDRARWDQLLIRRGLAALERADMLCREHGRALGPYALQAAIAACHARARKAEDTDWQRIAALYDALAQLAPSPVVELNRAVAVAMAFGPAAGLELVDSLVDEPALRRYHLLPSVRGDLLHKLGRLDEARLEFERAAALTRNERERTLLLERAGIRSASNP